MDTSLLLYSGTERKALLSAHLAYGLRAEFRGWSHDPEESADASDDMRDLISREHRMYGESEHRPRRFFRARELSLTPPEIGEARLEMQRERVVHLRFDACRREVRPKRVAPGRSHHVLVKNVTGHVVRQHDVRHSAEPFAIRVRDTKTRIVPSGEVL
jgi:hypothetical protein